MRIMDCVMILFRKKIDLVKQDPKYNCPRPSWSEATKFMVSNGFLNQLLTFPTVSKFTRRSVLDDCGYSKKVCLPGEFPPACFLALWPPEKIEIHPRQNKAAIVWTINTFLLNT